jgi:hypothetical protein
MDLLFAATMARPDPDWTDADRGRIPASEYKEMQVLNSLREEEDDDFRDELEELMMSVDPTKAGNDTLYYDLVEELENASEDADNDDVWSHLCTHQLKI